MKLKSIAIKNFRCYKDTVKIELDDLTAFVGKNDAGKSTILEALDIFFNEGDGVVKIDENDINRECKNSGDLETCFTATFTDLPDEVDVDAGNKTTLKGEYLLNQAGELVVVKKYSNGTGKVKTFLNAYHPQNGECCDLLGKNNSNLKKQVEGLKLECDKTKNAEMRRAIWECYKDDLQLGDTEVDISKGDGIKSIWEKLKLYLPSYSLFRADRENSDKDSEVQDPIKEAVKQIIQSQREELSKISEEVTKYLKDVSARTLEKVKEMNPEIATSLHPTLPDKLKWEDVFKGVSIVGDKDVPLNKRGSGIRRLILLSFFRAEAERKQSEKNSAGVIYAIEEPETSLHVDHQKKLIEAFSMLSKQDNIQILLTTHSGNVVKMLDFSNLRIVQEENGKREIINAQKNILPRPSLNEINYCVFGGESAVEFHNELYGYLQAKAILEDNKNYFEEDFDKWLKQKGLQQSEQWIKIEKNGQTKTENRTLSTFIRNSIHHPENTKNKEYTDEELRQSIDGMIKIFMSLDEMK